MSAENPRSKAGDRGGRAEARELEARAASRLEQGRVARKDGDLAGALRYFKAAGKAAPNSVIARSEVAHTFDLLGRPQKALTVYQKILEQAPDNMRALAGASLMTFKLGDREAALERLEAALGAAKDDPKKLLLAANAFREMAEPQRASEILRAVVRSSDGNVRTRAVHQLASIAAEHPGQAFALLDNTEIPDDPETRFELAEAICLSRPDWTKRGQSRGPAPAKPEHGMAGAISILEELAARQEGTWRAKALGLLGKIARYEHRWGDALAFFEKAVAAEPDNIDLLLQVGFALTDLSRLDDAKRQFELVVAKDARNVEALLGLGDVAKLQDDLKTALQDYERAAAVEPTNTDIHARLRNLQGRVGGFDWRAELDSAIEVIQNPDSPKGALVQAAIVVLRYGVTDVLRPVARNLESGSPAGRQIVMSARALDRDGLSRTRAQLEDNSAGGAAALEEMAGVVSKLVPGSETLLVIFGGAAGQLDITFSLFHRLLRGTGASALFVRDIEDTRYLGGIAGLGSDFDSTVSALRGVAEQSGAKRLLMIGNCQGTGAAIRYGVAAKADAILGFDPRIGLPSLDSLKPVEADRISRVLGRFAGIGAADEVYSKAAYKPRMTLIYDTSREPHATRVRELGKIEGVTAVGIPVVRSQLLRILLAEGLLTPVLNEFVANGCLNAKLVERLSNLSKK